MSNLVPILALCIPIVALITRHLNQQQQLQAQGISDAAASDLLNRAQRLEQRVHQLEQLLDNGQPGWRSHL